MKETTRFLLAFAFIFSCLQVAPEVLDLSFLPHTDVKTLADSLSAHTSAKVLELDISSSDAGDEALQQISRVLLTSDAVEDASLHLTAQMDGLTAEGVTSFLGSIQGNATDDESNVGRRRLKTLDLSWNRLDASGRHRKEFDEALQKLLSEPSCAPTGLYLEHTGLGPATCRAIAKGIIMLHQKKGVAALAAAIKTVSNGASDAIIFDELDLSSCDIGDAGAEALALALESSAISCIRHLILSNNRITEQGANSLGKAYQGHLDLSNNPLGDRGVSALCSAIENGRLSHVTLRSCSIHAEGAEQLGKALRVFALSPDVNLRCVSIDLSGNPLGVLRGKMKESGKYSASVLKSKASSTAVAFMNQGMSFLQKGLGQSVGPESDDDEEKLSNSGNSLLEEDLDPSRARCGLKALANAFIGDKRTKKEAIGNRQDRKIHIGLRHTYCDSAGADALAAMVVAAKEDMDGVGVELEVSLNPVVEESMLSALHGNDENTLQEGAERHNEAMEIIRESRERASEAARLTRTRLEADLEEWDMPQDENEWDSDADYD